jgi:hypothetical protein
MRRKTKHTTGKVNLLADDKFLISRYASLITGL